MIQERPIIEAWFDGGITRNPGGTATWGAYALIDGVEVWTAWAVIGHGDGMTNNVAEYAGCLAVLQWLLDEQLDDGTIDIVIYGDSQLVINQLNWRQRKIFRGAYAAIAMQTREVRDKFRKQPRFEWIPREQNARADELARSCKPLRELIAEQKADRRETRELTIAEKPLTFRTRRRRP